MADSEIDISELTCFIAWVWIESEIFFLTKVSVFHGCFLHIFRLRDKKTEHINTYWFNDSLATLKYEGVVGLSPRPQDSQVASPCTPNSSSWGPWRINWRPEKSMSPTLFSPCAFDLWCSIKNPGACVIYQKLAQTPGHNSLQHRFIPRKISYIGLSGLPEWVAALIQTIRWPLYVAIVPETW